jgi:hypothetical protein
VFSRKLLWEGDDMQVVVQVISPTASGNMRILVLKYDVTYNERLEMARWQLLPGQGELIQPSEAPQAMIPEYC